MSPIVITPEGSIPPNLSRAALAVHPLISGVELGHQFGRRGTGGDELVKKRVPDTKLGLPFNSILQPAERR
jgi:hypothetical protein